MATEENKDSIVRQVLGSEFVGGYTNRRDTEQGEVANVQTEIEMAKLLAARRASRQQNPPQNHS